MRNAVHLHALQAGASPVWQCWEGAPCPRRLGPTQRTLPQWSILLGPAESERRQREGGAACRPSGERGHLEYSPRARC